MTLSQLQEHKNNGVDNEAIIYAIKATELERRINKLMLDSDRRAGWLKRKNDLYTELNKIAKAETNRTSGAGDE